MKKIHITYLISDINKAVFFEHTALRLRERGVELSWILINSKDSELAHFLEEHHFEVAYLEALSPLRSFSAIKACKALLKQWNATVVHCHLGTANWVGLWAGLWAGVSKRIFTRHAGKSLKWNYKEAIIDQIQNRLATDIVSISLNIHELLLAQGVSENKIHLIHHGFDLDRMKNHNVNEVARIKSFYNPQSKYPIIGVVARWMEWKGMQYIIPAFEKLLEDYPNAKLCLFNASEKAAYAQVLTPMLEKLPFGSYESIDFESNVYDLYSLFDLYIHTPVDPYCEAFGQTYIEALAAGVPSIFTLSGVAREFVAEEPLAQIVPFRDSEAIYSAMLNILTTPNKDKTHSPFFQHFELENYIAKLELLYLLS
jgi:glycosyltransferase involved in cell wall biosynthesis